MWVMREVNKRKKFKSCHCHFLMAGTSPNNISDTPVATCKVPLEQVRSTSRELMSCFDVFFISTKIG